MIQYLDLFTEAKSRRKKNYQASSPIKKASLYYIGYDPGFHKYTIYNGERTVSMTKKSLHMGKKVCEDWASLLWSEKLDLAIPNKEKAIPYLVDIGFWKVGAKAVELAFGIGISAIAVCIDIAYDEQTKQPMPSTGKISLEYYSALDIVPLSYEAGEISEVALFSQIGATTKMTAFLKDPDTGKYTIGVVTEEDGKQSFAELETDSDVPMFAVFHPNAVDNLSANFHGFPSILQNSIDTLRALDNSFDGMDNEVTLGRKRIFASAALNKVVFEKKADGTVGEERRTFDPNDTVIYALPETNGTENEKPFLWSPNDPLRIDQYTADITLNLQLLSQQVGLGANYYRFEGGRIMTATQVISQNSDTFRNLKKHEQAMEPAIKRLYRGIAVASVLFTEGSPLSDAEDVAIIFDDSIIEDRATEKESDTKDLQNGIISKAEFRARWRGETLDDAKKGVNAIAGDDEIVSRFNALAPAIAASIVTTKLAVFIVFDGKEELLKKAGYGSIEDYAADVEEKAKAGSITADDLLGFNNRATDGASGSVDKNPEQTDEGAQGASK
jgi:hypothetical protein